VPARRLVTYAGGGLAGVSAELPVVREALMVGNLALAGLGDMARGTGDVARGLVGGAGTVLSAGAGLRRRRLGVPAGGMAAPTEAARLVTGTGGALPGGGGLVVGPSGSEECAGGEGGGGGGGGLVVGAAGSGACAGGGDGGGGTGHVLAAASSVGAASAAARGGGGGIAGRAARATQTLAGAVRGRIRKIIPRKTEALGPAGAQRFVMTSLVGSRAGACTAKGVVQVTLEGATASRAKKSVTRFPRRRWARIQSVALAAAVAA